MSILGSDRILSSLHYAPLETFISKSKELKSAEPRLLQPRPVSWMNGALGRTFSVSILLTFTTLFVSLRYSVLRYKYGFFAATVMLLYTYSFANSLGIAIIHSLDIARFLSKPTDLLSVATMHDDAFDGRNSYALESVSALAWIKN